MRGFVSSSAEDTARAASKSQHAGCEAARPDVSAFDEVERTNQTGSSFSSTYLRRDLLKG
jgi:hypothetical protein